MKNLLAILLLSWCYPTLTLLYSTLFYSILLFSYSILFYSLPIPISISIPKACPQVLHTSSPLLLLPPSRLQTCPHCAHLSKMSPMKNMLVHWSELLQSTQPIRLEAPLHSHPHLPKPSPLSTKRQEWLPSLPLVSIHLSHWSLRGGSGPRGTLDTAQYQYITVSALLVLY